MSAEQPGGAARFVGQRVARKEDRRLLTGRGTYVDDIVLPGMLEVAFVRSPVARGRIRRIDLDAARALPGVRAIYTAEDLKRLSINFFNLYSSPTAKAPTVTPLAVDRVCHVGDPIAVVIADNRYIAEDGVGLVEIDYDIEDAVVTIEQARTGPSVHAELESNLAHEGVTPEDPEIAAIFAGAAHVVTGTLRHQRQIHAPMETRGIVVSRHGMGELTVYAACQSPHMAARYISMLFGLPNHHVRVISKDVGGAFGLKVQLGREEVAVVAAGLLLGRPLKWIEDRLENLTAGYQAREQDITVKLALDRDGKLLAADLEYDCNIGAYPQGADSNSLAMMMFPGPYHLPRLKFRSRSYYSNTSGQAAYRGPWMIESLARETMLDVAARQIGLDPVELRRRNLIRREDQPFSMVTGPVLDRVTPRETLDLALAKIDVPAFRAEQAAARLQGRYLGLGVAVYVEPTTMAMGGVLSSEVAQIRVEPTGKITAVLSTHSQGHGTETTMAQVIADQLGVDWEDITVLEDDSSRGGFGAGAGGSRQAVAGGGAARRASDILKKKIKTIAAHMLNANPDDIEMEGGRIRVAGVDEVGTTLKRIAEIAYLESDRLPPDMELGLEAQYRYRPPPIVFSNASHACVCEVDVDTGKVSILRWVASEDCGVMINPSVVEGQIAGGVVQGIGGVLLEHATYDDAGNPTSATFKDYLLPSALDVPQIEYCHLITPSETEGGFKGVGEGGAIIGPPTMVNAVADALAPFGIRCLDLPLTPATLVAAIDAARLRQGG
jgi:carbon-monoxide dehydrogenase large subunit